MPELTVYLTNGKSVIAVVEKGEAQERADSIFNPEFTAIRLHLRNGNFAWVRTADILWIECTGK